MKQYTIGEWEVHYKESLTLGERRKYYEMGGVGAEGVFDFTGVGEKELKVLEKFEGGKFSNLTKSERMTALSLATKVDVKKQLADIEATILSFVTTAYHRGNQKTAGDLLESIDENEAQELYSEIQNAEREYAESKKKS